MHKVETIVKQTSQFRAIHLTVPDSDRRATIAYRLNYENNTVEAGISIWNSDSVSSRQFSRKEGFRRAKAASLEQQYGGGSHKSVAMFTVITFESIKENFKDVFPFYINVNALTNIDQFSYSFITGILASDFMPRVLKELFSRKK